MNPLQRMGAAIRAKHAATRRQPPHPRRMTDATQCVVLGAALGAPKERFCLLCGDRQADWICARHAAQTSEAR